MKKFSLLLLLLLVGCGSESELQTMPPNIAETEQSSDVPDFTPAPTATPMVVAMVTATPVPVDEFVSTATEAPISEITEAPLVEDPEVSIQDIMQNYISKPAAVFVDITDPPDTIGQLIMPTSSPTPTESVYIPINLSTPVPLPTPEVYDSIVVESPEIYDVILFWGQSNMNAWPQTDATMPAAFADRYQYSIDSGIDLDIVMQTVSTSEVATPLTEETAYWYRYLSRSFEPVVNSTKICGEGFYESGCYNYDDYEYSYGGLKYNPNTGKLEQYYTGGSYVSIQTSPNQNMIPEFCRTYYEATGHRVIAVTCAVGGAPIQCFLPATDPNNHYVKNNMQQHYMYEALVEYYNSAVSDAVNAGYTIGGRYWVCFQGEGNFDAASLSGDYYTYFTQVKNNIAHDTGTTLGAIVYVAGEIGSASQFPKVSQMHKIQEQLIADNADIIAGSSFDWEHYVPDEANYYSDAFVTRIYCDAVGNKIPYTEALRRTLLNTSYEYDFYLSGINNRVHLLSSTLSQVGRDCARSLAAYVH